MKSRWINQDSQLDHCDAYLEPFDDPCFDCILEVFLKTFEASKWTYRFQV